MKKRPELLASFVLVNIVVAQGKWIGKHPFRLQSCFVVCVYLKPRTELGGAYERSVCVCGASGGRI